MKTSPRKKGAPLLLLDRDGTLVEEADYPSDPRRVRLLSGVPRALRRLRRAGFKIAVVTNQSGVARGFITLRQMHAVNKRFLDLLKKNKAPVDGLYWCPHQPKDRCRCRKPRLGMARRAARDFQTSWKGCISVGDRWSDVRLGQRTGGAGVLVLTGYGRHFASHNKGVQPDHQAATFARAADWIIKMRKGLKR